jgi:hypothetical protein
MTEWAGRPGHVGWHALKRRRDGAWTVGFWTGISGWRVADAIGRTTIRSEGQVGRLYDYGERVALPS